VQDKNSAIKLFSKTLMSSLKEWNRWRSERRDREKERKIRMRLGLV
jgi:hypothetical protein